MASIYDLKPKFQALLRPLTRALFGMGVTANQVTVFAALLSALTGLALLLHPAARWPLLLVPAVLFARMALNAIDGMLAREHGQKSRLGAVLNELSDVLADAALYLPFGAVPWVSPRLVVGIVVLAIVSEMAGVVGVQIGASRRYDGPMGKSDRAFAFGLLALLLGLGVPAGRWINVGLAVVALLAAVTIVNRCRRALAEGTA
ncbi:MAG: CDP-alcohol phosphatidyltransferase family protein [Gemmatimonadetes bacterium]|nr:CDP-alcohol phosphatidyltransferase family protein [Gemmatimonadota bacterium]MBK6782101.1 CDP-alcohol phosphatidyltransferase family protein [Gemmatimonadota bacterium]MBK7351836.1 CDP-alcohol phosphatidyltransferase family protein [Gemmatimonadota bacterium]MBK7715392.1 CDP-alcohol phosphatidyltransferase family protein [Gemmatimonadota bacterium]MBK7785126.1 CDP-alcohol phosphatidyltransferase family protein [Gemmatimonadota bacterium]